MHLLSVQANRFVNISASSLSDTDTQGWKMFSPVGIRRWCNACLQYRNKGFGRKWIPFTIFFQIKLNHWNLQKTPQYGRYLYFMIFIALWVKKSPQRQRLYKLHMVTENVFLKVYGRNTSDHSTKFNHNNFNSIVRKNVTTSLMWKVFNDELKNPNSWLLWKLKETVLMSGAKQRLYVEHIY